MSKPEDLRKILVLGMILEFSDVMFRPRYEKNGARSKIPAERTCFRILMKAFATRYATRLGDAWVHPSYLYKISLVKFATGLIRYKTKKPIFETCLLPELTSAIMQHFEKDHSDLVPSLKSALENEDDGWLAWEGPNIFIQRREIAEDAWAEEGLRECRQWSGLPVYT